MLFLVNLGNLLSLDILVWLLSLPLLVMGIVFMILQVREHRRLKHQLEHLEKVQGHTIEYDLVMKTMQLSVWRIDVDSRKMTFESDYRILPSNLQPSTGISIETLTGYMLPKYRAEIRRVIKGFLDGTIDNYRIQYEARIPHSDRTFWGESYVTVDERDVDGRVLSVVGTSMCIDKQKEIERALIEARNQAEESDRLKSAFLANISHEIRTPLNAIVGFSEVLPMAQSEEERSQLVGLIKQNNAQLLRLFDDMVNMSKLEAGGNAVSKSHFELNKLLAEVAERYSDKSTAAGVKLLVEEQPVDPKPLTDRRRLLEILNQYVDNAIKFTDKGSVTLGYNVSGQLVRVWVKDTGKGIPPEYCNDHLFERFVKVDEFIPGTGLGLSICRGLAHGMDGKLGVESKLGEGSCFWVEFPLE